MHDVRIEDKNVDTMSCVDMVSVVFHGIGRIMRAVDSNRRQWRGCVAYAAYITDPEDDAGLSPSFSHMVPLSMLQVSAMVDVVRPFPEVRFTDFGHAGRVSINYNDLRQHGALSQRQKVLAAFLDIVATSYALNRDDWEMYKPLLAHLGGEGYFFGREWHEKFRKWALHPTAWVEVSKAELELCRQHAYMETRRNLGLLTEIRPRGMSRGVYVPFTTIKRSLLSVADRDILVDFTGCEEAWNKEAEAFIFPPQPQAYNHVLELKFGGMHFKL